MEDTLNVSFHYDQRNTSGGRVVEDVEPTVKNNFKQLEKEVK